MECIFFYHLFLGVSLLQLIIYLWKKSWWYSISLRSYHFSIHFFIFHISVDICLFSFILFAYVCGAQGTVAVNNIPTLFKIGFCHIFISGLDLWNFCFSFLDHWDCRSEPPCLLFILCVQSKINTLLMTLETILFFLCHFIMHVPVELVISYKQLWNKHLSFYLLLNIVSNF